MDQKLFRKNKWLLYFSIVFLIYGILLACYLTDLITSFLFLGLLFFAQIIIGVLLLYFRKKRQARSMLSFIFTCIVLLMLFEARLTYYEAHRFTAHGYSEPEELIDGSGIFMMCVASFDVYYLDDEDKVRRMYAHGNKEIYQIYKTTNLVRYKSKMSWILEIFGLYKESFDRMKESVQSYVGDDLEVINDFFNRTDLEGDSAGLALGLVALIDRGTLQNDIQIAVTGALEKDGNVRVVGSVEEKMLIAEENSLPYFIVPKESLVEAMKVKNDFSLSLTIIPVSHIDEAVERINELNNKSDIGQ